MFNITPACACLSIFRLQNTEMISLILLIYIFILFSAFWGDSDDTNSDIEMALRPRSRDTNNSDFDDFYD